VNRLVVLTLALAAGACGPRGFKQNTDLAASVAGRCRAIGSFDQFRVSTSGPYLVLVRDGGRTLWQSAGKAGESVEVPIGKLGPKASEPLEVDVFAGDFPPGSDLPPGAEKTLGEVLGKMGKGGSKVTVCGNVVPLCGTTEGCTPPPCPEPPHGCVN
jgi:hypothetical protein